MEQIAQQMLAKLPMVDDLRDESIRKPHSLVIAAVEPG